MPFCMKCGSQMPDEAAFCINCGAKMGKAISQPVGVAPQQVNTAPQQVNVTPQQVNVTPQQVNEAPQPVNVAPQQTVPVNQPTQSNVILDHTQCTLYPIKNAQGKMATIYKTASNCYVDITDNKLNFVQRGSVAVALFGVVGKAFADKCLNFEPVISFTHDEIVNMYFEKKKFGTVLKFDRNDGMIFQIAAVMPALQTIENWWKS